MKIIITEDQFNNLLVLRRRMSLRRRLADVINVASELIDMADDFYGNLDFCKYYPTFHKFIDSVVRDITEHYYDARFDIDDVSDFIYQDVGYENFVKILMEEHGAKIRSFYNLKTKYC
jgi:hypothetical protein